MTKCEQIVNYFGGTVMAFRHLMEMHRLGMSRHYKCKDGKLSICQLVKDFDGYLPVELELALEETLAQQVLLRHKPQHIEYVDADTYPEVYHEHSRLDGFSTYFKSPKLLLKYFHRGEINYVTGHMLTYNDERPNVYHLDGHNGDWHNTVKGWAYC